jgi:hypothetical protein
LLAAPADADHVDEGFPRFAELYAVLLVEPGVARRFKLKLFDSQVDRLVHHEQRRVLRMPILNPLDPLEETLPVAEKHSHLYFSLFPYKRAVGVAAVDHLKHINKVKRHLCFELAVNHSDEPVILFPFELNAAVVRVLQLSSATVFFKSNAVNKVGVFIADHFLVITKHGLQNFETFRRFAQSFQVNQRRQIFLFFFLLHVCVCLADFAFAPQLEADKVVIDFELDAAIERFDLVVFDQNEALLIGPHDDLLRAVNDLPSFGRVVEFNEPALLSFELNGEPSDLLQFSGSPGIEFLFRCLPPQKIFEAQIGIPKLVLHLWHTEDLD